MPIVEWKLLGLLGLGIVTYASLPVAVGWLAWRLGAAGRPLRRLVCAVSGFQFVTDLEVPLQRHASGCGAACAEMILGRLKPGSDPRQLAQLRAMSGTSMLDLREALGRCGVPSSGERLGTMKALEHRRRLGFEPVVALDLGMHLDPRLLLLRPWAWVMRRLLGGGVRRLRHWVVVEAVTEASVEIADPSLGRIVVPRERFARSWDGVALLAGGG